MAYERKIPIDLDCGVTIYQIMVGGKWKPYLINCMNRGICRLSEFQKIIPGATKRVLAQQLKEMERMGLISKHVFAEIPLRTEYRLTPLGESAIPIIRAMDAWGLEHSSLFDELGQLKKIKSPRERNYAIKPSTDSPIGNPTSSEGSL